jgi:hypothetical protein
MAQIARQQLRAETPGEAQYIESLRIQCRIERLTADSTKLQRVEELFQRTTHVDRKQPGVRILRQRPPARPRRIFAPWC